MFNFAKLFLEAAFSSQLSFVTEEVAEYAAEAVVLGREWKLGRILKRAFYELARKDPRHVGYEENNDDSAAPANESGDGDGGDEDDEEPEENDEDEDNTEASMHRVDAKDLVRLVGGQKHLMSAWLSAVMLDGFTCGRKPQCTSNKARIGWEIVTPYLIKYQFDPICGIQQLIKVDWVKKGYCEQCMADRVTLLVAQRKQIWADMDDWFDLE